MKNNNIHLDISIIPNGKLSTYILNEILLLFPADTVVHNIIGTQILLSSSRYLSETGATGTLVQKANGEYMIDGLQYFDKLHDEFELNKRIVGYQFNANMVNLSLNSIKSLLDQLPSDAKMLSVIPLEPTGCQFRVMSREYPKGEGNCFTIPIVNVVLNNDNSVSFIDNHLRQDKFVGDVVFQTICTFVKRNSTTPIDVNSGILLTNSSKRQYTEQYEEEYNFTNHIEEHKKIVAKQIEIPTGLSSTSEVTFNLEKAIVDNEKVCDNNTHDLRIYEGLTTIDKYCTKCSYREKI